VLAGRWKQLDPRWNQGSIVFTFPTWEQSPYDVQTFSRLRSEPYIVHFTTRDKPWRPLCHHPFSTEFFQYLDRTEWCGWRPPRLETFLELLKVSERQLRRGSKWLRARARQWVRPLAGRVASS